MPTEEKPKSLDDWKGYWAIEFKAARDALDKWHEQSRKIDRIVRDERETSEQGESRWNLYSANLETKAAMLYGRTPEVDVARRFADQNDDVGRVAGDLMTRLLNTDIERKSDGCKSALKYALKDRLMCGWGFVRARYVVEFGDEKPGVEAKLGDDGTELAPAVPPSRPKSFEDVETDYIHWEDQLWSPSRFFHEMRWHAHRNRMDRKQLIARFGEKIGAVVPLKGKDPAATEGDKKENDWDRADVWEIWDKDAEQVFWFVEDYGVLEVKPDPYELEGFWPFPEPMIANTTTSKLVPRPDYVIAQDLYQEVNRVSTRINKLIQGIRLTGIYDAECEEIARMLEEPGDGNLIPVKNWLKISDKGGIGGAVQFFPLENVATAIVQLRDYRRELVDIISQVTGMSDLMRGEATQAGASATEQRIKARVGSVRMQSLQDDFARFASELQAIRGQLVAKYFDPQTILQRSNANFSTDKEYIGPALELIKSPQFSQFRIEVKPEAVSLTDFAALKAERMEVLAGLSGFFQMAAPIVQAMPGAMPFLLQIGQWGVAGMKGSSQVEAAFDKAIQQAEQQQQQAAQNPQPPPPDPKLQAEQTKLQGVQMKVQGDMQREQFKHQAKLEELQAETVASDQQEQSQATWNVREQMQKAAIMKATRPVVPPKSNGVP